MKVSEFLSLVRERLGVDADRWLVRADRLADDEAADFPRPRYVWVPTFERFGPPERAGGNPRPILTREAGLELHLWSDGYDACEDLLLDVIGALHDEGATSVIFDRVTWTDESAIGRGWLVTLEVRIKTPVTRRAYGTGRAQQVQPDTSDSVADDGNLDWGES